ncbi:MAG: NAD(P)H-hydrate epimerase, partial [Candidatus Methanofastidiosia archaeon]
MDYRIVDTNARYFGLPSRILMENAGKGIADFIKSNFDKKSIAIICGTGNNGGDGFVVARHLEKKYKIDVIVVGDPEKIKTKEAHDNYKLLSHCNVRVQNAYCPDDINTWKYDLIIDAMLGTGIMGNVREPYASYIKKINSLNIPIISIDLPSGYKTDLSVKADKVVSLHTEKTENAYVLSIGIPHLFNCLCGPGNVKYLSKRATDAHKGQGGVLAIVGGSYTYHGAPAYASLAASKICDLVYVICPEKIGESLRTMGPDLIVEPQKGENLSPLFLDNPVLSSAHAILCGI